MAVTKEVLTLAVEVGDALLRNGAEVYRVEDTVTHILNAYEIEDYDVYVLSNGIFASANEGAADACSVIRHAPLSSTHLGRVSALNQLSREICSHECSLIDAWTRLEDCKHIPEAKPWVQVFFCGLGSASFCYLFAAFFILCPAPQIPPLHPADSRKRRCDYVEPCFSYHRTLHSHGQGDYRCYHAARARYRFNDFHPGFL